jgi:hypothetical protein
MPDVAPYGVCGLGPNPPKAPELMAGKATVNLVFDGPTILGAKGASLELSVKWDKDIKPTDLDKTCRVLAQSIYSTYKIVLGFPPFHGSTPEQRLRMLGVGK